MTVKRKLMWALAAIATLLIAGTLAGYFYLRSESFRAFALRKVVEQADLATGGKTAIGRLHLDLSTLTATLYDITIRGTEAPDQPPLLHADRLSVGIKIVSILRRQVVLQELLLDHPVVHIEVARQGTSNLPTPPPSQSTSQTSVFDLAVAHTRLTNGEVDYRDQKLPLDADLYNLATDIRFESVAKGYEGELSYTHGQLHYAGFAPLEHHLELKFSADPQHLDLKPAVFNIGSSEIILRAELKNYADPVADGNYQIRIHAQDFAGISRSLSPAGDLSLNGRFDYHASRNKPLLRSISTDGQVASDVLAAVVSRRRFEVRRLRGAYRLDEGNLQIRDLSLESFGGRIVATADIQHLDATPESAVQASLERISLRPLQQLFGPQTLQTAVLSGTVRGKAEAMWKGSMNDLRARADLTVAASAKNRSNPSAGEVPLAGTLHATYDGRRQTIELHDTTFTIPSATLTAQGTISNHSNLQVHAVAHDLHQLALLGFAFSSTETTPPAVSGSANISATVQGSLKKPTIVAQLSAENLEVEGSEWKTAKMEIHASPSQFSIDSASLDNAHQGHVNLSASAGLENWGYQPSNPIQAHVDAHQLRIADLQALAEQHFPVSGDLSANLSLRGSQLQPVGSGSLQIDNAHVYGEALHKLTAKLHAENGSISSTLNAQAAAGSIDASLSYNPGARTYKLQLDAPSIVVQKLEAVKETNLGVNGTVSLSANGEGTVDDPGLVAKLKSSEILIRQNSILGIEADIQVSQRRANLDFVSEISQASVHAHGTVSLTGDYDTEAVIDTGTIPLEALIATYAPGLPQGFQGQTELHATLKGPLRDKSRIEAHLTLPTLKASYQSLQVGIAQPIHLDYANSILTLRPVDIEGTETRVRAQGQIPIGGTAPPTFTAQGSINVGILRLFAPDLQTSGTAALDLRSSLSSGTTSIQGQIELRNVALSTSTSPLGVERLNGTVDIAGNHLQISQMTGQMGGGQISLGGSVTYRPAVQFNLALQGRSIRLRYPEGLRSVFDANLMFSGNPQASTVSGRVLVDSLSFTPDFDLSTFADQFTTGNRLSQPGFADTVRLAIGLQSQQDLSATSSQISIAGQAGLRISGTAANPVITGRMILTSGELFYRNVRYQLERGIITFDDPNETRPVLNVAVTTTVQQYNLTLTLRGPLDKLTTSYLSDPPLATADIINLIARGQTTEQLAANSQSTDSMIASQVVSQLSSGVQRLAGISSLQIDPTLGGNNRASAQIAIQQRVTKDLLFSFSTDVSQPGGEIIQGEYQINQRWSVSAARDELGGFSIDGRYHKRF